MIRIVLADDHAVVRQGIRDFLEADKQLTVVAVAGDGEQAIALAHEHKPDVIVLDVQMPKRTGIEVARQLRSDKLRCGILIVTAYDDDPFVLSALQAGASGYVLKTAEPEELIAAVHAVHEGRAIMDSRLNPTALLAGLHITEYEPLSQREIEVLQFVARGYTNKAIAAQLEISDRTVQGHLANIFTKLHAESRTDAVMIALRLGMITIQQ